MHLVLKPSLRHGHNVVCLHRPEKLDHFLRGKVNLGACRASRVQRTGGASSAHPLWDSISVTVSTGANSTPTLSMMSRSRPAADFGVAVYALAACHGGGW